jgi:DNA-binding NtrC family response regulator
VRPRATFELCFAAPALTKPSATRIMARPMAADEEIPSAQILVVDDETAHAEVMAESLRRLGHVCTLVHNLPAALDELNHGQFDLIITDLVMDHEDDGLKVLAAARESQPQAETILVTAHGDVPTCKQALKQGAYDFIEKPLDLDIFRTLVQHAIQAVVLRNQNSMLRERIGEDFSIDGIVGTSPGIRDVVSTLRQVAPVDVRVLITGESGTGKELVAQAIHNHSKRAKKHFVPLNCAGMQESILEDELFGHVRGAFTGADKERQGRFEYADGGTLFLDEIGDMPLVMQAKLLRVLESNEVVRLGSNEPRKVNVRVVSATNRDLMDMVKKQTFREDLFYRIKGVEIRLPALRERPDDIPLLAQHFLQKFAAQFDRVAPTLSEDARLALMRYTWPGNIRQLMGVVQSILAVADGDHIEVRHLPPEVRLGGVEEAAEGTNIPANLSLDQIEKQAIRNALRVTQGNREAAAKMLGIGERTLYRKLREYGLK